MLKNIWKMSPMIEERTASARAHTQRSVSRVKSLMCFLIDKHLSNSCQLSDICDEMFLRQVRPRLSASHSLTSEYYCDRILLKGRTFSARVRKKVDSRLLVNFSFTHEPPVDRSLQPNLLDTSTCVYIYIYIYVDVDVFKFIHPSVENSTFTHSNYTPRFLCSCFLSFFFAIVVVNVELHHRSFSLVSIWT